VVHWEKVSTGSLDELFQKADIISLNVPKQADGSAVIGKAEIEKMKDGVILINTSRGGTIEEGELIAAIENGKVRAAALDVFENEPSPREDLLKMDALSLSPHIGAATLEAQSRIGEELADFIIEHSEKSLA
jgi:D-3-phosphoglycerate dehydrogenase